MLGNSDLLSAPYISMHLVGACVWGGGVGEGG